MNNLSRWLFTLFLGKPGEYMSTEDREISDSIRKLKTLKANNGHIYIDPSEVLTEKFIKERRDAARLLSK